MNTITVVGLGPGRPELLTLEAREALGQAIPVILRTRRHPTVAAITGNDEFRDCDDIYQLGGSFEDVYQAIVERVLAVAAVSDVVYAVPGHPLLAERTVPLLAARAADAGHRVVILPAVSFADAASVALGVDLAGMQICDATDVRIDAQRPALIGQVYDRDTATRLKMALLDVYPAMHAIRVVHAAGTPGERVVETTLAALDHQPPGYLDTVYVPGLDPLDDVRRLDGIAWVVRRLHADGGCPWDREQTHLSLRKYLLEEAYEALEAIDSGDPAALAEELGDVLLQVLMHAEVGARSGTVELGDITEGIARKLVRRHSHVFADGTATTAAEVEESWDRRKQAEKARESILDGLPAALPALALSQSIQGRVRRAGFDWPGLEGPLDKLVEEVRELTAAEPGPGQEEEMGDLLFVLAGIAQRLGIEAEDALRAANAKFKRRYVALELAAARRSLDLRTLTTAELEALWADAKLATSAA
jgi:tetrapyrrole methylase family protein/MazG family protein